MRPHPAFVRLCVAVLCLQVVVGCGGGSTTTAPTTNNPAPAANPGVPDHPSAPGVASNAAMADSVPSNPVPESQQKTVTTESGLSYIITATGNGDPAKKWDNVKVHYTGWLYENGAKGAQFDSSLERGQPLPLQIGAGRVIKGWEVGLEGMLVGEKRTLIIPPDLGYGARQMGNVIPPNSTLLFEVQLMGKEQGPTPSPIPTPPPSTAIPEAQQKEVTNPSGLKYTITATGDGKEAVNGFEVKVHYTGWLYENGAKGTQFDTSLEQGMPLTFQLGAGMIIKGWEEGVLGMKVGEKRTLLIPPSLAYGERGAGGVIPPNATLLFEVQLVDVKEMPTPTPVPTAPPSTPVAEADRKTQELEQGLKVIDYALGSGDTAVSGKKISVHYTGWLAENGEPGTKFDSSKDRGMPLPIVLGSGQVIPGWDKGIVGMKEGGVRRLIIPSDLAYGPVGRPPVIPGGATLIFDVDLISVE